MHPHAVLLCPAAVAPVHRKISPRWARIQQIDNSTLPVDSVFGVRKDVISIMRSYIIHRGTCQSWKKKKKNAALILSTCLAELPFYFLHLLTKNTTNQYATPLLSFWIRKRGCKPARGTTVKRVDAWHHNLLLMILYKQPGSRLASRLHNQ